MDDTTADLISVQTRHAERLGVQGWAAIDAYGSSRIGLWPRLVSDEHFMLVLLGEPGLNQPEFIALIWVLINGYG
ncbi:MAG: hypothetical protein KZQ78_05570 [Candidatus Thiodiazotropha sp. (ex Ustalcina ferruginea)]|nr:hypothetical protein [Candidatus Thiodiazotropha sp. (ex Ustalcina ferruginea)]